MKMIGNRMKTGLLTVLVLAFAGCGKHEKPTFTYMPDMAYSPAIKAQEEGWTRLPPEGTVSTTHKTYPFPNDPERAGRELRNPLPMSREVLYRGKNRYNTYCIVCHGQYGEGDGSIVPKFPRPPSLQSDKVRNWSDGRIFHVISQGQNLMPSYAPQMADENDRWAVAHYIRVLHRAKKPTAADRRAYEQE